MKVHRIAAFSDDNAGGNPAGVVLIDAMPPTASMQRVAAQVGYSETAFAERQGDDRTWRVRYFSPESEVPFCGHATIALGAVLAQHHGDGVFELQLNDARITVEGSQQDGDYHAALQSPPTHHQTLNDEQIERTLALFGYRQQQLSDTIAPARIHAGADHYVFALDSRESLAQLNYDLDAGRRFMREHELVTIMFVYVEGATRFHARNAFASGGVLEDPATGAAAAAFAGYLRDSAQSSAGAFSIVQGEDMGARSVIKVESGADVGSSIRVSGATRELDDAREL